MRYQVILIKLAKTISLTLPSTGDRELPGTTSERRLSTEYLMLLHCGDGEES